MRKIYILFDVKDDSNDKQWLLDEMSKLTGGGRSVGIRKNIFQLRRYGVIGELAARTTMLMQCFHALCLSKGDDVIICWNHMSGLFMNRLSMLFGNKRELILMNWLSPVNNHWLKSQRVAALNPKVRIITNSPESPQKWEMHLGLSGHDSFYVVPDVYNTKIPFEPVSDVRERYCFTGGMNNRNWNLIMQVAAELRDVKFVCVALKKDFKSQVVSIPGNVEVFFDLPADEYYRRMKGAYLILLPLIDDRVAGLINILRSAQSGTPCMISKTPATEQYYSEADNGLLVSSGATEWIEKIMEWFSYDYETYREKVEAFCSYIKETFSPQEAARKIWNTIR